MSYVHITRWRRPIDSMQWVQKPYFYDERCALTWTTVQYKTLCWAYHTLHFACTGKQNQTCLEIDHSCNASHPVSAPMLWSIFEVRNYFWIILCLSSLTPLHLIASPSPKKTNYKLTVMLSHVEPLPRALKLSLPSDVDIGTFRYYPAHWTYRSVDASAGIRVTNPCTSVSSTALARRGWSLQMKNK